MFFSRLVSRIPAIALIFCLGATGNASPAYEWASAPWTNWSSTGQSAHPLVGRIWDTRRKAFIPPHLLADRLSVPANARYVLLGETHDNPDHHRLQAWIVRAVWERNSAYCMRQRRKCDRPVLALEMIREDKQSALTAYLARPDRSPAGLGPALGWSKSGWPAWELYRPIAEAAMERPPAAGRYEIRPADIARSLIKEVARKGYQVLAPPWRRRLGLATPLAPPLVKALEAELMTSHCGMLPKQLLPSMARVQRLRDASFAYALAPTIARVGTGTTHILIAGNGHVRVDRGVPWYLRYRLKRAGLDSTRRKVIAVMMVEVHAGERSPEGLVQKGPDGRFAADYVWFTPRKRREDPCEQLRKRLGKKKR